MGNILCKDPYNNPTRKTYKGPSSKKSKSFENVMFPNNNNLNNSKKTSTTSTIESKWNQSSAIDDKPPVAPPRKKRRPGLPSKSSKTLPLPINGFKDVFGAETRRHSANEGTDTVDKLIQRQNTPISEYDVDANDDKFSDFLVVPTKHEVEKSNIKVPKVGNEKSDKFFGESLSASLSEEPYYATVKAVRTVDEIKDDLEEFVEKNVLTEQKSVKPENYDDVNNTSSLDRKAEFLMAMLEDYSDSKRYGDALPVTEEVIVPKRRKSKHICDDEDQLHDHLHKNELKIDQHKVASASNDPKTPEGLVPVVEEIIVPKRRKSGHVCDDDHHLRNCIHHKTKKLLEVEATIENPPRKPDRDFAKFKMTVDDLCSDSDETPPQKTTRKKVKKDSEDLIQLFDPSTSVPKSPKLELQRMISEPLKSPQLVNSSSTSSFLDLKKCQSIDNFMPEDQHHTGCDDQLILPTSKLTCRKISTKSMPTTSINELNNPKFTFSSSESDHSTPVFEENPRSDDILKKKEENEDYEEAISRKISTKSLPASIKIPTNKKKETLNQLQFDENITDKIDNPTEENSNKVVLSPKILQEQEIQDLKEDIGIITDVASFIASSHVLDDQQLTNVIDKIYESNTNILKDFQSFLEERVPVDQIENEKIDLVESEPETQNDRCLSKSIDDDEENERSSEDSDEVGEILPHHMAHVELKSSARRESIEDVNSWFEHLNKSTSTEEIYGNRKGRPDGPTVYDTSRQYPFGDVKRVRNDSSSELFDVGVRNRSGSVGHSDMESADYKKNSKIYKSEEAVNRDHSTLLKFLAKNNEF